MLLNSHGGNEIKPIVARVVRFARSAHLFLCNWYKAFTDEYANIFDHPDDHAGEMETSFAMAYFPELINRKPDGSLAADDGTLGRAAV